MPLCSALASLPAASAEHEDDQQNASHAQSHAEDQERRSIQLRMVAIQPGKAASGKATSAFMTLAGTIEVEP